MKTVNEIENFLNKVFLFVSNKKNRIFFLIFRIVFSPFPSFESLRLSFDKLHHND